ncbi:MAG: hypothetical protein AB7O52_13725 [Planctomycetota bacterium]
MKFCPGKNGIPQVEISDSSATNVGGIDDEYVWSSRGLLSGGCFPNVNAWKSEDMASRWAGAVFLKAEKKFRKVRSYRDIPSLVSSVRKEADARAAVA